MARTKWGAIDLDTEVLRTLEATGSLLEEMGHVLVEVTPY
ncbi:hypothetical protein X756_24295 [Mesorhizobium sp. LSHC412B00]|nr:hypothetical protein X756_24295 [Mesorhizobium sp. LSHC412B00]